MPQKAVPRKATSRGKALYHGLKIGILTLSYRGFLIALLSFSEADS